MSLPAYYNEIDPNAAAWLRELIAQGHIAPGDVDERSIEDIAPNELAGYGQHHFFAGIGGWSYALRLAGWPDDRPVWTGSCPCQPFSSAGAQAGFADERHLWPAWFHLIRERRPAVVFGEQVASAAALPWIDLVQADLEGAGYALGKSDICAAGVGAPHIRQRLWFVAHSLPAGRAERWAGAGERSIAGLCGAGDMADADMSEQHQRTPSREQPLRVVGDAVGVALGDANDSGLEGRQLHAERAGELVAGPAGVGGGMVNTASEQARIPRLPRLARVADSWRNAELIPCTDGKVRPIEPGTFPLAHGVPARMVRLRGYGNAINPEVAAQFIGAYQDIAA